jgi:hypothetical protein
LPLKFNTKANEFKSLQHAISRADSPNYGERIVRRGRPQATIVAGCGTDGQLPVPPDVAFHEELVAGRRRRNAGPIEAFSV